MGLRLHKPKTENGDPVQTFARWLEQSFVFPSGPKRGQPVTLLPFQLAFVRDVLARDGEDPAYRMALFSTPRKNGKTFLLACLLLAFMCEDSPAHIPGCRAAITAPTARHALFVFRAAMELLKAAGRDSGAAIKSHPSPGYFQLGKARCDIHSGAKTAGHGESLHLAIVDEIGLLPERSAGLIDNFLDALAIENGQFLGTGTRGTSRAFNDLLDEPPPRTAVHLYGTERGEDPADPAVWQRVNPGLGQIKSLSFMRDSWAKAKATGSEREFIAWGLNGRLTPAKELLVDYATLEGAYDPEAGPLPDEPVFIGLDLGGSAAQTAACVVYASGFVRILAAFPSQPFDLAERGKRDGCGDLYLRGHAAGDLIETEGTVTDLPTFLAALVAKVGPHPVASVSCDRYRSEELRTALHRAGLGWKPRFRGSSPRDGNADILATRRLFLAGAIKLHRSQLLEGALAETDVRVSFTGAAQLDKSQRMARIDLAQALVLGCSALLEHREAIPPEYSVEIL